MNVLIAAVQFSSEISGLQRHALNLVRCLLRQEGISRVHFALAPWQREMVCAAGLKSSDRIALHVADVNQSLISRNFWYYHSLPQLAERVCPEIVHLSYPVPIRASAFHCPRVLTLHDLYPYEIPENFGFPKVLFHRLILQQCLRNVDGITCVSDTTLQVLRRYTQPSVWRRSIRIHNCVELEPGCAEQPPIPDWHGEPFFLTVSQHRKNKNIPLLIRGLHRLLRENRVAQDMKLIVVGIPGPETAAIYQLVTELQLEHAVIFLHGIKEPALQWCYQHCEALLAPSETEGFGLSVAEALLVGCRVVCSDIPAFHEIDELRCRFVPMGLDLEERFTDSIVDVIRRPRPAPGPLPHLSLEAVGAQYLDCYRNLLSTRRCEHVNMTPAHLQGAIGREVDLITQVRPRERSG